MPRCHPHTTSRPVSRAARPRCDITVRRGHPPALLVSPLRSPPPAGAARRTPRVRGATPPVPSRSGTRAAVPSRLAARRPFKRRLAGSLI